MNPTLSVCNVERKSIKPLASVKENSVPITADHYGGPLIGRTGAVRLHITIFAGFAGRNL
jgi:hypothetical protein